MSNYIPYLSALIVISVFLQTWVNHRQPTPYMDELFHVPQAQNLCWSVRYLRRPIYSKSITTPPGLYLPNVILGLLFSPSIMCSTKALRVTSSLMNILTFVVIFKVITALRSRLTTNPRCEASDFSVSFALTLIPVSFFYSNLYYTDTSSTFYILLAWYFSLSNRPISSAVVAIIAAFTRQTNAAWHFFIAVDAMFYQVMRETPNNVHEAYWRVLSSLKLVSPHLVSGVFYLIFLCLNRGVAIGDRANHTETVHHATVPYLSLFHSAFFIPFQLTCISYVLRVVGHICRTPAVQVTFITAAAFSITFVLATGDYAHPFVLSDNRHLIFYIYRRWIRRSTFHRVSLVPLYAYAPASIHVELLDLSNKQRFVESIMDFIVLLCASAVLMPNALLEPRYYIVPNLFIALRRIARTDPYRPQPVLLISLLFLLINVALVYVFTELSFHRPRDEHMPEDTSPGRFMI